VKKLALLLIAIFAPSAGAVYKCVDEKGVTHIGDTPPAPCASVMMLELSPSGTLLRRIEPSPTPEQLKAKLDEAQRNKEASRASGDQKRKDEALLSTYGGEREFEMVLNRNIEPIKGRIASAQDRMKAVEKRSKEIEEEMEFYKAGKKGAADKPREAPPMLVAELQRLTTEKAALERSIAAHNAEIEQLRTKFDVDKKRWMALKSGTPPGTAETAPAPVPEKVPEKAPAKSAEKAPVKK
jgi:Domain of unknown function (DUF4124)